MKKTFLIGLWIFFKCFLGVAGAMDAVMTLPEVDIKGRELRVSSTVDVDFNSRLKEALDSGMEINFSFTMELYRIRSWWWDENVATVPVAHLVKYDNLKKEYLVGTGEEGDRRIVRDYQKMKETILQLKAVQLSLPGDLERSGEDKFYVRIMGEMPSFDPDFWFFSSSEFSTPWVESKEFSLPLLSPPPADGTQGEEMVLPEEKKDKGTVL